MSLRDISRLACVIALVTVVVALTVKVPAPDESPSPSAQEHAEPRPSRGTSSAVDDALRDREKAIERLERVTDQAHVAVSVRDQASGVAFDYGSGRFPTASLVKIHFAALMSWRAERSGEELTAAQRRDIEQMLVRSENEPALRAYFALGGPPGIEHGLDTAFGKPGVNVGDQGFWGHSFTTPREVVALLDRVLDPGAWGTYALMQDAMARVTPELRWGITALADDESLAQVKVGFVEETEGWVVNSSGRVIVDGGPVVISVMTDRNPTFEDGVATIEEVARLVGEVVRAERAAGAVSWKDLGTTIREGQGYAA